METQILTRYAEGERRGPGSQLIRAQHFARDVVVDKFLIRRLFLVALEAFANLRLFGDEPGRFGLALFAFPRTALLPLRLPRLTEY